MSNGDSVILKNLMLLLKTKSLTSENMFRRETREVDEMFMDLLGVFQRFYDQAPEADKLTLRSIQDLIILVSEQVHSSHRQAESTLGDFKNYVSALEGACKSFDGDFEKSVTQPAEKEAQAKDEEEGLRAKLLKNTAKRLDQDSTSKLFNTNV